MLVRMEVTKSNLEPAQTMVLEVSKSRKGRIARNSGENKNGSKTLRADVRPI